MLLGLKSPLVAGQHLRLGLTFKSGARVSADAVVRGLSDDGASG
jgi:copper(I)-binding protein